MESIEIADSYFRLPLFPARNSQTRCSASSIPGGRNKLQHEKLFRVSAIYQVRAASSWCGCSIAGTVWRCLSAPQAADRHRT